MRFLSVLRFLCRIAVIAAFLCAPQLPAQSPKEFVYATEPESPRWTLMPAVASMLLPGLDQIWEGRYAYGVGYAATALAGYALVEDQQRQIHNISSWTEARDFDERPLQQGLQLINIAGGLSSYHAYRSAVISQQRLGRYGFMSLHDSMDDVLAAPFRFEYLSRWTTIVPLSVIGGLAGALLTAGPESGAVLRDLSGRDLYYAASLSYGAGVWEEAVFRGWVMPEIHYYTDSALLSNGITSALFAAAHYPQVDRPVIQFVLGAYLGWLSQRNQWSISEAIFIHAWWDVIAFLTAYSLEAYMPPSTPEVSEERRSLRLTLPALQWAW